MCATIGRTCCVVDGISQVDLFSVEAAFMSFFVGKKNEWSRDTASGVWSMEYLRRCTHKLGHTWRSFFDEKVVVVAFESLLPLCYK